MTDAFSAYRVFPRAFAIFYLLLTYQVCHWAMALPDMSNAQAAFVASIVAGAAAYFKFYVETGTG